MTRESILSRLKKLFAHAESAQGLGNQAEAEAFVAKAQELLDRHELTMTDVEYFAAREEDPITQLSTKAEKKVRVAWRESLASIVARAHHCRIIVHPGSDRITFIGRGSHAEVARFVYMQLVRFGEEQSMKDWAEFYKRNKGNRGYRAAWFAGFVNAIRERYREQAAAMRREYEAQGHGVALIRLENAGKAVEQYMKEKMSLTSAGRLNGRASWSQEGRRDGARAGQQANLNANGLRTGSSGVRGYLN